MILWSALLKVAVPLVDARGFVNAHNSVRHAVCGREVPIASCKRCPVGQETHQGGSAYDRRTACPRAPCAAGTFYNPQCRRGAEALAVSVADEQGLRGRVVEVCSRSFGPRGIEFRIDLSFGQRLECRIIHVSNLAGSILRGLPGPTALLRSSRLCAFSCTIYV